MLAVNLVELRKRHEISRILRVPLTAGRDVLRILLGLAACSALAGCVTDLLSPAAGPATVADAGPAPSEEAAALDNKASAMVAQARALAFADPAGAKPSAQIDLAMLAMRSNPNATHRLDGPSAPGATSGARLAPDEVMARLRELSHEPPSPPGEAGPDERSRDILARLQALSHRGAPSDAAAGIQPAAPPPARPAKPVSPEAVMRRLKELSGAGSGAGAQAGGAARQAGLKPGADAFGGLVAVVPTPDMALTPAVERAIQGAAGAAQ